MPRRKTHQEFVQELHQKNGRFREGKLKLINDYTNKNTKVQIEDSYGICEVLPDSLLKGHAPLICSAIDKTSYWINMAIEVHGDRYDYSLVEFLRASIKIKIICEEHGMFEQTPNNHLRGKGCLKCAQRNDNLRDTFENAVKKANKIHNFRYNYPHQEYINARTKLIIECTIHGEFKQTLDSHLRGSGCPECSFIDISNKFRELNVGWKPKDWVKLSYISKNFDSFKVYIIKCWDENEEFYKIGRTFTTMEHRFKSKRKMPYNYSIMEVVEGSAEEMYNLENELQRKHKEFEYTPKIEFAGITECFSEILQEEISKYVCY